jgi:hypothetical protein
MTLEGAKPMGASRGLRAKPVLAAGNFHRGQSPEAEACRAGPTGTSATTAGGKGTWAIFAGNGQDSGGRYDSEG